MHQPEHHKAQRDVEREPADHAQRAEDKVNDHGLAKRSHDLFTGLELKTRHAMPRRKTVGTTILRNLQASTTVVTQIAIGDDSFRAPLLWARSLPVNS